MYFRNAVGRIFKLRKYERVGREISERNIFSANPRFSQLRQPYVINKQNLSLLSLASSLKINSIRILGTCSWRFFKSPAFKGQSKFVDGHGTREDKELSPPSKWGWKEGELKSIKKVNRNKNRKKKKHRRKVYDLWKKRAIQQQLQHKECIKNNDPSRVSGFEFVCECVWKYLIQCQHASDSEASMLEY